MKRTCILVLGAHRSGTSALARTLNLLGADLPTNLLEPQPDNPTGFWESRDHMALNEELLTSLRLRWDLILSARWDLLDSTSFGRHCDRIVDLLRRDFESSRLFVVKDPRICRLLPFWRAALEQFGAVPKCILLVRHPLEVAASLTARNKLALQTGLLIWLRHMLEAERASRELNRLFVSYELLLNDWRAAAFRISQVLSVEWPRTPTEAASEIDNFLRRKARHQLLGELAPDGVDGAAPIPAIRKIYEVACAAARGEAVDVRAFDELCDFLSASESIIRPIISESQSLATDNERLRTEAVQRDQANDRLRIEVAQLDEINNRLRTEVAQRDQANERLRTELVQRDQANDRLRTNTGHLRGLLSLGEHELSDKRRDIADLQDRLLSVGAELKSREAQIAALGDELNWREAQIAALGDELKWREGQIAEHSSRNDELERRRTGAERKIAQLGTDLWDLRGSVSWRMTAPIREIHRFWTRLRRATWPREYRFGLRPALQLRCIDYVRNLWEAEGSDPQFLLIPRSRSGRLPTRWCEIEIGLDNADRAQQPILYLDTGAGFIEDAAIRLPRHECGRLKTVIDLQKGIRSLRLRPRQEPGRFEIKHVVIREIGRERARQFTKGLTNRPGSVSTGGPSLDGAVPKTTGASLGDQAVVSNRAGERKETPTSDEPRPMSGASKPELTVHEVSTSEQTLSSNGVPAPDIKVVVRDRLKAELAALLASRAELMLPQAPSPLTSIVLVLYNQAELTYKCLCSIVAHAGDDAEVIIVDNVSTDRTPELLKRVPGAIVVRNAENLYFPHACNQAAGHARGKYLLLLNNDAQLLPGSLQAAIDVLEQDQTIGAVGGPILDLTGRVQEAGSIVWSDGSALGYGRGDKSEHPQYMFRRDVDFCSAAFLLTRTELFRQMGGFDEVFSPAYYEEVDFCVRLRKQDLRVVYEPRAAIVHFEYGSSDPAFAAALMARNRQIFRFKHPDYLVTRESPDPRNALRARHARRPKMRIVFIDDCVPHLDQGSGYPRANAIANAMMTIGAAVTLFPMRHVQEPWGQIYRDLPREIEVMADRSADSLAAFLKERRGNYDVIFVSRPHNMRRLLSVLKDKGLTDGARLVYDAEAIFALRSREKARLLTMDESRDAADEMVQEIDLAGEAHAIVCVSELEASHFVERGLWPVHILGHSLRLEISEKSFEERRDILFVGAMNDADSPNEDSVLWFTKHVLPLVRARLAAEDLRFLVVGQNTAQRLSLIADDPSVELGGSVEDLSSYYDRARIFVAPTRFAAGIPIKLLEAAARGVPIVATSLLAAQLGWVDGEQLLTASANNPERFADQCARLYEGKELWLHLRQEAAKRAQQDCSPEHFQDKLRAILEQQKPLTWAEAEDAHDPFQF